MAQVLTLTADCGDRWRLGNYTGAFDAAVLAADPTYGAFKSLGVPTAPTVVTLTVQRPDGTQIVWAWPTPGAGQLALQPETGMANTRFYGEHTWDMAGEHWCKLVGTGAVTTVDEWGVYVDAPRIL